MSLSPALYRVDINHSKFPHSCSAISAIKWCKTSDCQSSGWLFVQLMWYSLVNVVFPVRKFYTEMEAWAHAFRIQKKTKQKNPTKILADWHKALDNLQLLPYHPRAFQVWLSVLTSVNIWSCLFRSLQHNAQRLHCQGEDGIVLDQEKR